MLKDQHRQWPSVTVMEDGAPRVRALHMVAGLLRGFTGCKDRQ